MHHSAERVDTYGAFWFSPLDMVGWTALFSLCADAGRPVTPEAAIAPCCVTTFLSVFQHANVRTPRWLGLLVQRPESHSFHHERGVHAATTRTCRSSTCCSARSTTRAGFARSRAFTTAPRREYAAPAVCGRTWSRPPTPDEETRIVMSKYRHQLPQLRDTLFLTDGGLETTLIFDDGIELPYFAAFDLLKNGQAPSACAATSRPTHASRSITAWVSCSRRRPGAPTATGARSSATTPRRWRTRTARAIDLLLEVRARRGAGARRS